VTGIPYGRAGAMFTLRADHDEGDYLCSRSPRRAEYWQRGDPTTGLPAAALKRLWAGSEVAVDPMVRARGPVAKAHHQEVHTAGWFREVAADRVEPTLSVGGAA
jgi:hypothetical protein